MKVILAVNGEGYGHATRCHALLQHIYDKHEIKIFAGGKAYEYLSKYYLVEEISSLNISYEQNTVSNLKTAIVNILRFPKHIKTLVKIFRVIREFKPNLIINDFEIFTNYISFLMNVPLISIDNEQIINCTNIEIPQRSFLNYLKVATVIRFISPYATHRIIPTFFYPKTKQKNVTLISPLVRKEIINLKPKNNKHILVYQTTNTNAKLIDILKKTNYSFVVYGFGIEQFAGNITYKLFDKNSFLQDLSNASAVILNGGFSLISEALALGKPILALPIKGQFEQLVNAYYIKKLKYGNYGETEEEIIKSFLKNKNRKTRKTKTNEFKTIDNIISKFA